MKIEITCNSCGMINRNEVPIPAKEQGLVMTCLSCEYILASFYSDESLMGKHIADQMKHIPNHKKAIKS